MKYENSPWYKFGSAFMILLVCLWHAPRLHAGKYAADFLRIGVGAKPLAMGGAFVALANDGTSFYWNPAGLSSVRHVELNFEHAPMFGGLAQYNAGSLALKITGNMALGLSWIRLGVDEIPIYSELPETRWDRITNPALRSDGEPEGYFTDSENAVMLSFARKFEFEISLGSGISRVWTPAEISFGVNYKYIEQRLGDFSGSGQGLDAGVLFRLMSSTAHRGVPVRRLGVGVCVQDFSKTTLKWNSATNAKDQADLTARAGLAYSQWFAPLRTDVTFVFDRESGATKGTYVGGELAIQRVAALRLGSRDGDLTVGVGLKIRGFRVDYAFVGYELHGTHRISGTVEF